MAHTYEELKHKTLADLREIAKEADVQGYTQMNKEHLLPALCEKLNIDMHAHHEVVGLDKAKLKVTILEHRQLGVRLPAILGERLAVEPRDVGVTGDDLRPTEQLE